MKSKRLRLELVMADVCLPDYWAGSSTTHISVGVDRDTTTKEIRESLFNMLDHGEVQGEEPLAKLLRCEDLPTGWQLDHECRVERALRAAINRFTLGRGKPFKNDLPDMETSESLAYFYVIRVNPDPDEVSDDELWGMARYGRSKNAMPVRRRIHRSHPRP